MKPLISLAALLAITPLHLFAGEKEQTKANALTPKEIADGWILLFDGETTYGWKTEGNVRVREGALVLGGDRECSVQTPSNFGSDFEVRFEYRATTGDEMAGDTSNGRWYHRSSLSRSEEWATGSIRRSYDQKNRTYSSIISSRAKRSGGEGEAGGGSPVERPNVGIGFVAPAGANLEVRGVRLKPVGLESIFSGKDLFGWKEVKTAKSKSRFTVTKEGWLNIKDGPGDLQTEDQWDDFVLQLDCISNGPHLNSGVFFRCIPGLFWSGYEAQIRNQWQGNDRTKPVDYGTGGIYNRQPARRVVSSDHEWFTMTIVAEGKHLAVWVNGYQTADFTDTRPIGKNARQNCKVDKGPISLQGHDPTTDLSFRNMRIEELPKAEAGK